MSDTGTQDARGAALWGRTTRQPCGDHPDRTGHPHPWVEELQMLVVDRPQFVVQGPSVNDRFLAGDDGPLVTIEQLLARALADRGIPALVVADPVEGFEVLGEEPHATRAREVVRGLHIDPNDHRAALVAVGEAVANVSTSVEPVALLVRDASRLVVDASGLSEAEQRLFARALRAARRSEPVPVVPRAANAGPDALAPAHNPVIWLTEHDRDLPVWFLAAEDRVRTLTVGHPQFGERLRAARSLLCHLPVYAGDADAVDAAAQQLAGATDGMGQASLRTVIVLATSVAGPGQAPDLVRFGRMVRLGVTNDPWSDPDLRARIDDAEATLAGDVLGQLAVVRAVAQRLSCGALGLTGAHRPDGDRAPRLVLFLLGPTGVGKTQLARSLSRLIFGDEDAMFRLDMSAFAQEHAAHRLIGAPPGYVGHDAGGELTNRMRDRPHSLVLFDEIEKAHPSLFDLFLQILDAGRLDDSVGRTVHFSESVIVFTSNLGVATEMRGDDGRARRLELVTPDSPAEEVRATIRAATQDFFRSAINRPEVLGRLGDNLLVFDFIRPDVAEQIFVRAVDQVVDTVRQRTGVEVVMGPAAMEALRPACIGDLSLGARHVGDRVNSTLTMPLSRHLGDVPEGMELHVVDAFPAAEPPELEVRRG